MKQVVSIIGDVIETDEDTDDRHRLDRARLLVRTPLPPAIMKEVIVRTGDADYRVWLVEEVGDDGAVRRTRTPLSEEWTEEITSVEEDDDDDDTTFSYSAELSSTKNQLRSSHQSHAIPSGYCCQTPNHSSPLDNTPSADEYIDKSGDRGEHTQGSISAKVDPVVCFTEKAQGNALTDMITLDPAKAGSRQPVEDQIGNFLNCEDLAEKEQNIYGVNTRLVTDRGSQPGMPSLQFQKAIGPSSISGPIMKMEGCKKENHPTSAQTSKGSSDLFSKVYVRQRHGPSKAAPLEPVVEEDISLREDKGLGGLNDSSCKGPNNRTLEAFEGFKNTEENSLEDLEEAMQQ